MNVKRLERLAKLLDQQTDSCPIKFNLASWGTYKKIEDNICGTAACAVGLACFNEDFNAEGLGFKNHWAGNGQIVPTFNGSNGWSAVSEFFGITKEAAAHLFHQNHYESRRVVGVSGAAMVAARIREEIKKHQEK